MAILSGASSSDIDYQTVLKLSGERGQIGITGNDGNDGINGFDSKPIFRKVNFYDYENTPSVTYDGTNLNLPGQWSENPYEGATLITFPERVPVLSDGRLGAVPLFL